MTLIAQEEFYLTRGFGIDFDESYACAHTYTNTHTPETGRKFTISIRSWISAYKLLDFHPYEFCTLYESTVLYTEFVFTLREIEYFT